MSDQHKCEACRDTGWISFSRRLKPNLAPMPWAAACLCERGMLLTADREHNAKSLPHPRNKPVTVAPIDREIYYERLQAGMDRATGRLL